MLSFEEKKTCLNQRTDSKEQRKWLRLGSRCFWDGRRVLSRGRLLTDEKGVEVIEVTWPWVAMGKSSLPCADCKKAAVHSGDFNPA